MAEKIVLVTAGGHIASFHAAMKAMHDKLRGGKSKLEIWGARGGGGRIKSGQSYPADL